MKYFILAIRLTTNQSGSTTFLRAPNLPGLASFLCGVPSFCSGLTFGAEGFEAGPTYTGGSVLEVLLEFSLFGKGLLCPPEPDFLFLLKEDFLFPP